MITPFNNWYDRNCQKIIKFNLFFLGFVIFGPIGIAFICFRFEPLFRHIINLVWQLLGMRKAIDDVI